MIRIARTLADEAAQALMRAANATKTESGLELAPFCESQRDAELAVRVALTMLCRDAVEFDDVVQLGGFGGAFTFGGNEDGA